METKTNMGALTRLLLGINIFIAMSSGGALGAAALVWVNPGVRALLPPAAAAAAPLLLSALAAVALAPALLLVVARHTPTVLYSVSYSVWCRCLAAALVWVNPGVRALLPPAAAAAAPLLLSALAAVALAPALLLVVARHTPTVLYSVSYSVWCRCLAAALVWVNPGVRALLPPAAAAAAPLLLSALAAVALAPALLLVVARHTPTVLYSVSYSVWCRCLAAALVWVNPGVRALLPPAAAAAAPLLLSALAAVALAPALLLVVARHTPTVLYSVSYSVWCRCLAAALVWVNPGVRALLPPAAAAAAPLLLSALAAVALAPALLLVVARHTPTVLYSVSYSVWCRCLAAALVWVNPGVRALLPPAAAAAAPLLLSALAAVALAPALLLVVARHTPTVLYSVSYSVWCRCLAAALVWVNPGVRALLPPAAAAAAPLLLSALAAVALAPALLLVVARHTPTVLYSVSYSVWCRCLAAALVWVNPGVRALLPPAAAAAAPLLLSALAAVALAPALLLVVVRHTPSVLYSYAALLLCVACGAAGAGGWLALVLARAVLDNTPRMAASGARVLASTITGGLIGPGQTATTYVAYSLNIIVGAAWAALTGLAQVAAAVVAAVAARRAARKLDVIQSI